MKCNILTIFTLMIEFIHKLIRKNIMTVLAEKIYNNAITLNPIERAGLIEKLIDSFSATDVEIELKWKQEVKDRQTAYDSGQIPSDSVENVFKRLAQR